MKFYTCIKVFNESSLYDDVDDEIRITNMRSFLTLEDAQKYQKVKGFAHRIIGQTIKDKIIVKLYHDLILRHNDIITEDMKE